MRVRIVVGDVLSVSADILVSTANPWLNLSGAVNGAIREAVGPELQTQLHSLVKVQGLAAVPAGTVVRSDPFSLPFKHILHAVAIDPFYDSSIELVKSTFAKAMDMAVELGALSISSPTLATGYGPMSIGEFGTAIAPVAEYPPLTHLTLTFVVKRVDDASALRDSLSQAGVQVAE